MQSQQQNPSTQRPVALQKWDEVEPGWWFLAARDDTEVHVQPDSDLGWCCFSMKDGDILGFPTYRPELEQIVALATDLLATHDRLLH